MSRNLTRAILATSLVAGTCDALGATVHYLARGGRTPLGIWRYVASALFGPPALAGGNGYVVGGLALHYAIAMIWTALYFWLASRLPLLRTHLVASAVLYGAFVWTVMTALVVPASRIPPRPFDGTQASIGALVLMLCIGLPCAVGARRFYDAHSAAGQAPG